MNTAQWITSPHNPGRAVETFRKEFSLTKPLARASLCISAHGVYRAYVNGVLLDLGVLTPGYTSYRNRIQYQRYDVTSLLRQENSLSVGLGVGWASGMGYRQDTNKMRFKPSLIAWLELFYEDGTEETVGTGTDWRVFTSQVLFAELYNGETIDKCAQEVPVGNAVLSQVKTQLIEQVGEWITEHERLAPIAVLHTPKGETVLDFGQNMTGYVEVKISGPRGSRIVLHHAEVLDKDGNFYNANYRSARNEMTYILSGGEDVFKPGYSFQGFRYVRLTEYPLDRVDPKCFRGIVVHSDMKRTGRFCCGNEKINQLYHNVVWGQKSNYLDVPTDCPQRDERLGWTGDAQVFCRSAAINYDVERFFHKWLGDMALEQGEDGSVLGIVPDCFHENRLEQTRTSAAWGDAACIIPWELYLAYGNREELRAAFPMMKKWVDYIHNAGPEEFLWLGGLHYGDWLAMDAGADSYVGATSNDLIASAFFAHSTDLVVRAGKALGEDVSEYEELYGNVVRAFRGYFMENGMPKEAFPYTEDAKGHAPVDTTRRGMTQTALVLILHFGLCTEAERPLLAAKLARMIRENGTLLSTGFVGTPYLLHALSDNGYTELAFDLLFQEQNPSWLYSVCHGATTMWEHWNSQKEDGSFWSTAMNSFNHYAYGAVFDWIFGAAAGIRPAAPGYREISVTPHPDKRLGFVDASIQTRSGPVHIHWYLRQETVYYEIDVPAGATAHLHLPSGYQEALSGGSYRFAELL